MLETMATFLRKRRLVRRMKKAGIEIPGIAYEEAKRAGLELAVLCAVLEQETGGGRNVYGHDRDSSGRIIWHGKAGTVVVTKKNYAEYKRFRDRAGKPPYGRMQGVGPMQLTWYTYQDSADRQGGCWNPRANVRVGAGILARNVERSGLWAALRAYNGSSHYADEVMRRVMKWRRLLKL